MHTNISISMDTGKNISIFSKRIFAAFLVMSAGLGLPNWANASLVDLKWDEQGRFQHRGEIKAGGILEVCGKLSAGLKIDWQYQSAKPLDFNIHFHEGKKVTLPVKYLARDTAAEQFEVKQSQDYCWMWSNKSKEAISVDLSLSQVQK